MVEAGASLLRALDDSDMPTEGAFWLLDTSERGWTLAFVSSAVDKIGRSAFYKRVADLLAKQSDGPNVSISYIFAASPTDPFVQLLRSVIHTGPGISGIRFTGNVVNGQLIPDVYVYRLT
jgi:hypothetical protein